MIRTTAVIERKAESLPAFIVLDDALLTPWNLTGTTVVEASINGTDIGRRTLKAWPERSGWFVDLTAAQMQSAGAAVGDEVDVELRRASTEPPEEILRIIETDEAAGDRWAGLSDARRRAIAEHVRDAKQAATRQRRALKALGCSEDGSRG